MGLNVSSKINGSRGELCACARPPERRDPAWMPRRNAGWRLCRASGCRDRKMEPSRRRIKEINPIYRRDITLTTPHHRRETSCAADAPPLPEGLRSMKTKTWEAALPPSRPFFATRFLPSDPIALRCAPGNRGVLGGPLLKPTSRRKPRWRSLPSKGDGNGTAIIKKKP